MSELENEQISVGVSASASAIASAEGFGASHRLEGSFEGSSWGAFETLFEVWI